MNGGVVCVECDPSRIARRIEYGYLDVAKHVADALRRAEAARCG
jgi:urocanate hydratase